MIELLQLSQVLATVELTGTEVRYHHEDCNEGKYSGWYTFNKSANVDRLVICADNQLNHSDLFDTVRHEAVHVAQACNGGPLLPLQYYKDRASERVHREVAEYPADVQHREYEAWVIAELASEEEVIGILKKFCF